MNPDDLAGRRPSFDAMRKLAGTNAAIIDLAEAKGHKVAITSSDQVNISVKDPHLAKDWHLASLNEIYNDLNTSYEGLSSAQHKKLQSIHGYNRITPPKVTPFWMKVVAILVGGFQLMMWFGAILCFIVFGITGVSAKTISIGY